MEIKTKKDLRSAEKAVGMSEGMQRTYDLVRFQIIREKCEEYYTMWYTDDIDGFLTKQDGKLKSFSTKREAEAFAKEEGLWLREGIVTYLIAASIYRKKNLGKFDCALYLDHWNIFSDAAYSLNRRFLGDNREKAVIQRIYEKLFYGCNLLVGEHEKHYVPKWSKKERRWFAKVMEDGFRILSQGLNRN